MESLESTTLVEMQEVSGAGAALWRSLEGSGHLAFFALSTEGRITFWSAGASHIFGLREAEVLKRGMALLFPLADRLAGRPENFLGTLAEQGDGLWEGDVRFQHRGGAVFQAHVRAQALGRGSPGYLLAASPFTKEEHLQAQLQESAQEIAILRRRKEEFLAVLAHEMRTPLAALKNAVALMRASSAVADRALSAEMIERQARTLARLLQDLLDVSHISAGNLRLEPEVVDVASILDFAVEGAQQQLGSRGQRLICDYPRGVLFISADTQRMIQVVGNLLSNAAKFTPHDGKVWLEATRDGDSVVIKVRDNGIGIEPGRLEGLFELFAQGHPSLDLAQGGMGIGLTIVRILTEMHGGEIQVTSAGRNQGTEFTLHLPVAAYPEDTSGEGELADLLPVDEPEGRRVLVVEDDLDSGKGLARLLRLHGYVVKLCRDGQEALASAELFQPDIVLLDLGLPSVDGFEVARRLRAGLLDPTARIICITGFGEAEDRRRSQEAGCDYHLVKPTDLEELLHVMEALA